MKLLTISTGSGHDFEFIAPMDRNLILQSEIPGSGDIIAKCLTTEGIKSLDEVMNDLSWKEKLLVILIHDDYWINETAQGEIKWLFQTCYPNYGWDAIKILYHTGTGQNFSFAKGLYYDDTYPQTYDIYSLCGSHDRLIDNKYASFYETILRNVLVAVVANNFIFTINLSNQIQNFIETNICDHI